MNVDPRHPGPMLVEEYLAPLGVPPAAFARGAGLDVARFEAICRGDASLDVEAAVRVGRALELSAERLVQLQIRHDLVAARNNPELQRVQLFTAPETEATFPTEAVLHGSLAETSDVAYDGYCWFFQEAVPGGRGYDGLHALWRGDRLRVYDPDGRQIYTGTVLKDLDGRMLLPFTAFKTWSQWFFARFQADLAIGDEHRAFLERLLQES